ncbi:MAG TPA: carboxypeptidase regulatory-like domain-containing protein [Terriglobia bacterium]|nr:carboxypeptidase regulatory-like domain-containing protein [Terriglobia bacterium]
MNVLLAAFLMWQTNTATGSINGVVVRAGTSLQTPLDSARVELSGGPGLPRVVRTDARGRFAFANLLPGSYHLHVTKDGYLRQEYGKRAAVLIKSDAAHKSVVFEMEAAPTIGGRVQNEFGEPIGNIVVSALRATFGPNGKRIFAPLTSALTDERGEYRLYWLDPGEYVIRASFVPPVKTPGNPNNLVPRDVYAPTYYSGASDLANAQRIPLRADQNLLAMDFRLLHAPVVSIRGTVSARSSSGGAERAPINTVVTLALAGDSAGAAQYTAKTNELGDFEISDVAPGDYIASAETMVGRQRYSAAIHIVVRDQDENNVGLTMSPGIEVLGRIAFESGAPMDWSTVKVRLNSADPFLESYSAAGVQADGQFPVWNIQPGAYSIEVSGIPRDFYIKAEHSGSFDLMTNPLGIAWDSPAPLQIIIGADAGRVDGAVTDPSGKAFAGAQVVLVPNAERRDRPDQYRIAGSDEDGRFELRGIPPGEYQIFAWENVEDGAWLNSEFMANYWPTASPFTVPASAAGTVQIPLIPSR